MLTWVNCASDGKWSFIDLGMMRQRQRDFWWCASPALRRRPWNRQASKTRQKRRLWLAQIVKAGWYREVGVKSLVSHTIRSMLGARAQLVGMRVEVTNQIRGILKTFGIVLSRRTGEPFERLVEEACGDNDGMLNRTVRSLLCVYSCLGSRSGISIAS